MNQRVYLFIKKSKKFKGTPITKIDCALNKIIKFISKTKLNF